MNKRQIFEQVSQLETQIGELYEQLGSLKKDLGDLIEENHRLTVENDHLRTYLQPFQKEQQQEKVTEKTKQTKHTLPSEGFDNLARLYKEGFHICHMHFGSPREDEDCLFCLDLFD